MAFTCFVLCTISSSSACHWLRWCCCQGSSATYSYAAAPFATPAASLAAVPTQAVTYAVPSYYVPAVAYAPVAQAPQGAQQGLLSDVGSIIEMVKLIRDVGKDIRPSIDNNDNDSGGGNVVAALQRIDNRLGNLEEGQVDLRGRLINNAGVSRSIGEELVNVQASVATVRSSLGANGPLITQLRMINQTLDERLPARSNDGEGTSETTPSASADFDALKGVIKNLSAEQRKELADLLK